jgi:hypothetical protein
MRGLGSLILVRQFSVDSMRYFPKVTLLSANPVNPAQYLVGCERDNRLLVIDSERGEIIRQISSRGFCMDVSSFHCGPVKPYFDSIHAYVCIRNDRLHNSARMDSMWWRVVFLQVKVRYFRVPHRRLSQRQSIIIIRRLELANSIVN